MEPFGLIVSFDCKIFRKGGKINGFLYKEIRNNRAAIRLLSPQYISSKKS